MKTIALVPARCGSKSIPFKNIKMFCGKPLIYWCTVALENAQQVDEFYVATDCKEIVDVVNTFGFSKLRIYNRSKQNAGDEASTESVMLEFLEHNNFADDTKLILVQPTSPFTTSIDFDTAISNLRTSGANSLISCVRTKRFFWRENGEPMNYDFRKRPRRQDFKGTLLENGAFYINSVDNILKEKNRLSGKIFCYEMPEYTWIELDEEDDWWVAQKLMMKHANIDKWGKKVKLFAMDVDGVLTDAGMYYAENGVELKKFNTHDGKGIEMIREMGIKTAILTSENTAIVSNRAKKLQIDYVFQGLKNNKLYTLIALCEKLSIGMDEVAYIGDDINCKALLENVGIAACPSNANYVVKNIPNIIKLHGKGGDGVVREFIEYLIQKKFL